MAVKKLLDENSLVAIKKYVDTKGGKVDDVKVNGTSILSNKIANIAVDGTYSATANKIASVATVTGAINALDVTNITGFGAGKTLATLKEEDGKISATFQDISITESQIKDFGTYVPASRKVAGLPLSADITKDALVGALGLTNNIVFVGVSTTDPKGATGATVAGHTTWSKGEVVLYGDKEYILTGTSNKAADWTELGDEGSHALKTITISAGSGLTGGGTLEANRTISHAVPAGAGTKASGFYKFSTDSFGHVNGTTGVAKADLTGLGVADDSLVVHLAGTETITGDKFVKGALQIADGNGYISFGPDDSVGASHGYIKTTPDGNGVYNTLTINSEKISLDATNGLVKEPDSAFGAVLPSTVGWTATRTLATLNDIPLVTGFVKGPATATNGHIAVFDGTTGKLIKDGSTALSTVTSHIGDTGIHVTTANKSAWNAKLKYVRLTEVASATTDDAYQKLQQSIDGTTYTDIASTLSYNEAWAILTAAA